MEPTTAWTITKLILKYAPSVIKSRLERDYLGYSLLKRLNLAPIKDTFDNVYTRTIYALIRTEKRDRQIMRIFEIKEVRAAFKTDLYDDQDHNLKIQADHHLHTNQELRGLKLIAVDINAEILAFQTEFKRQVNISRSPEQLENRKAFKKIEGKIATLQNPGGLRKSDFNQQIRTIEALLTEFKTTTAQQLINKLLEAIADSDLSSIDKNELIAKAYHLRSLCRIDGQGTGSSMRANIEAYVKMPSEILYKSRAATSYQVLGEGVTALKLAEEVLAKDGLNDRAWFLKLHLNPQTGISDVPTSVRQSKEFKLRYIPHLLNANRIAEASDLIKHELAAHPIPNVIGAGDIDYWCFIMKASYFLGIQNQPNVNHQKKEDYSSNELIKYANDLGSVIYWIFRTMLTPQNESPSRHLQMLRLDKIATFWRMLTPL